MEVGAEYYVKVGECPAVQTIQIIWDEDGHIGIKHIDNLAILCACHVCYFFNEVTEWSQEEFYYYVLCKSNSNSPSYYGKYNPYLKPISYPYIGSYNIIPKEIF